MNIKQTILMATATAAGLLGTTGIASADQVTVKSGDTLAAIAQKYNTTTDKLAKINKIENPDLIFAGEVIETQGHATTPIVAPAQTTVAAPKQETVAVKAPVAAAPKQKAVAVKAPVAAAPKQKAVAVKAPVAAAPKQQQAAVQQAPAAAAPKQQQAAVQQAPVAAAPKQQAAAPQTSAPAAGGSTYAQFLANGGSAALWQSVVMPESGGNPNAVSSNGYQGLGQTKEGWGTGSVAQQTQGMVNYANSRYGSVANAVSFRQANGWW